MVRSRPIRCNDGRAADSNVYISLVLPEPIADEHPRQHLYRMAGQPVHAACGPRAVASLRRPGASLAAALCPGPPARCQRHRLGVVHRLSGGHHHAGRRHGTRGPRRRPPLECALGTRRAGHPQRADEAFRWPARTRVHPDHRRQLRPHQLRYRPEPGDRGADAAAQPGGRGAQRHRHRRHRAGTHRQGCRLPPRGNGLWRLPRAVPHGGNPRGGLGAAARGAGRA